MHADDRPRRRRRRRRPFRDAGGAFDRVLLDPPCSGLGTLQRAPGPALARCARQDLDALAAEQDALLEAARANLRPGGTLVYAVCTLSPGEERLQRDDFWRTLPVGGRDRRLL